LMGEPEQGAERLLERGEGTVGINHGGD
jgi:hypothetical protein